MQRIIISAVVLVTILVLVASATVNAGNGKPTSPPGQGVCDRGNSTATCRPDPQPDHGKDCEVHGNKGGINEDHCASPTPTVEPTPTPAPTATPTPAPSDDPKDTGGGPRTHHRSLPSTDTVDVSNVTDWNGWFYILAGVAAIAAAISAMRFRRRV